VLEHNAKFRFDRRLQQRRGWIAPEQLDTELDSLPDVGGKGELVESPQQNASEAPPAQGDGE
jgi:hypothetical protein